MSSSRSSISSSHIIFIISPIKIPYVINIQFLFHELSYIELVEDNFSNINEMYDFDALKVDLYSVITDGDI